MILRLLHTFADVIFFSYYSLVNNYRMETNMAPKLRKKYCNVETSHRKVTESHFRIPRNKKKTTLLGIENLDLLQDQVSSVE